MTREKAIELLQDVLAALPLPYDSDAHNAVQFALSDMKEAQLREQGGRS